MMHTWCTSLHLYSLFCTSPSFVFYSICASHTYGFLCMLCVRFRFFILNYFVAVSYKLNFAWNTQFRFEEWCIHLSIALELLLLVLFLVWLKRNCVSFLHEFVWFATKIRNKQKKLGVRLSVQQTHKSRWLIVKMSNILLIIHHSNQYRYLLCLLLEKTTFLCMRLHTILH